MVDQILSKEPGFNYFSADKGYTLITPTPSHPHTPYNPHRIQGSTNSEQLRRDV